MSSRRLYSGAAGSHDLKDYAIKFLSGTTLLCVGGIGGYGAKGFFDMNKRIGQLDNSSAVHTEKLQTIEKKVDNITSDISILKEGVTALITNMAVIMSKLQSQK